MWWWQPTIFSTNCWKIEKKRIEDSQKREDLKVTIEPHLGFIRGLCVAPLDEADSLAIWLWLHSLEWRLSSCRKTSPGLQLIVPYGSGGCLHSLAPESLSSSKPEISCWVFLRLHHSDPDSSISIFILKGCWWLHWALPYNLGYIFNLKVSLLATIIPPWI